MNDQEFKEKYGERLEHLFADRLERDITLSNMVAQAQEVTERTQEIDNQRPKFLAYAAQRIIGYAIKPDDNRQEMLEALVDAAWQAICIASSLDYTREDILRAWGQNYNLVFAALPKKIETFKAPEVKQMVTPPPSLVSERFRYPGEVLVERPAELSLTLPSLEGITPISSGPIENTGQAYVVELNPDLFPTLPVTPTGDVPPSLPKKKPGSAQARRMKKVDSQE